MNSNDNHIKISAGMDLHTMERLVHLFNLCLYRVNLKTEDIDLNLNTTKITGHDLNELPTTDTTKDSMIHKDDLALVNSSIGSIVSGQKDHYHIEYRMHRKDSSIVWIDEVGFISEYDDDGHPLYMSAIASDLSRLKWAEEKARIIEVELKQAHEKSDLHELKEEIRLLYTANAAAEMIIGGFHQDYEMVLHQSLQMLAESLQSDYVCIWRNARHNGNMCCFLRTHWTTNAHSIGFENNSQYFCYDEFFPDWKSKLAPEKLYVILDNDVLSKEFMTACDMGNADNILLAPFYLHGEFWGMIGFARDKKIPFAYYEAKAMMSGAVIIANSISRNETFGKITMDREKAISSTHAKGEFLSRMSHEMRTPLNAIIGMTNIALKEQNPQKVKSHLKKVETSSQLLLSVINDVLDMSKIEAGKLEIVREPFNFNEMIQNAGSIAKVNMDEKKQQFTINCDTSLNHKIISDEYRLSQVIVNLLNNAMKFTPENGEISLTVSHKDIGNHKIRLRVEVSDSGIGLTDEQQKKLFAAFEQGDESITRKYGGTGLGLAICKKILLLLDGDIWVKSKLHQGSCFFFELRTELGEALSQASPSAGGQADAGSDAGQNELPCNWCGRTLLLAEDVAINREIVEMMLEDTGIKIVPAENGQIALDKFKAEPALYDLILMDMQMPVLDGLSATKLIREMALPKARQIPIIAMTANAFQEDIDVCLKAGMNEHIAKPFVLDRFIQLLGKYLT